ncbi:MAG: T9SS type A sorting domain-containing protein [Ignavibacteria bacterium]|nr:T9SS type A sorting domain-containing protein [Ignavibacteria bacterium]
MKKIFSIFIILIINTGYSQDNSMKLFSVNESKTFSKSEEYQKQVDDAVIFNLNEELYRSIFEQKRHDFTLSIPISANENINADLERFEILSPDAKFIEKSSYGEKELDLRNIILSYKGKISGKDNSFVSITFYEGKITGLIESGNEKFVIGALKDSEGKETQDHIIYNISKVKSGRDFKCGTNDEVPDDILKKIREIDGKPFDRMTSSLLIAKVAIDVDFFTYTIYGNSVPNASAFALAIMSCVSAVYVKDENVKLEISYLRVWTTPDPYTSEDGSQMLNQFRSEWVANQGGVDRTIAHLISRRNNINVAGIAYLNVLCNTGFGYGLSATLRGVINQLPSYSYDTETVAHEIGHNFGSPHTHNCSWVGGPIDTCSDVEGGCYNGPLYGTVGTIMSYCDISAGGSVVMDFGPQPGALIRSFAENAPCLTVSNQPVYTAFPNGGEIFRTLTTSKIYWGSSLTGNVNIEYTTNNGTSWVNIVSNVPAQQRQYDWNIPYTGYTNQAKVRVLDSGNPSVGDTSDAAFNIILAYLPFNLNSPPTQTRIITSSVNGEIQKFDWTRTGTHPSLKYKFKIRKIGAGGVDFTYDSDNNGADTVISLRKSFLDSLAQAIGTTGDSVRCSWRAWAFNGFDSAATNNTFLVTLIRTNVGISVISSSVPEKFDLHNNYPNPFNPVTKIKFDIAKLQNVKITVYDNTGREADILVNENLQPGSYEVTFSGSNYSSGVYYYKMESQDFIQTKKMLLIK